MRAAGFQFGVTHNRWGLYLCDAHYGSLGYEGYGGWNILQERYLLCLLFEYAAPLGLIDIVYEDPAGARKDFHGQWGTDDLIFLSRYDGLRYFRLIECLSSQVAETIAQNSQTARLCQRTGDRGLVVLVEKEKAFCDALNAIGYGMPRV